MKPRILSYGVQASHDYISHMQSINEPVSITGFDAFVIDPSVLNLDKGTQEAVYRHQRELFELTHMKGGIVICLLRPNSQVALATGGYVERYAILQAINPDVVTFVARNAQLGESSLIKIIDSAHGASRAYLQVLKDKIRFEALLRCGDGEVSQRSGTIFAVDSVGYPIAVEFPISEGLLSFVPVAQNVPAERLGSAIVQMVRHHFEQHEDSDAPDWVTSVQVPGANLYDDKISALIKQRDELNGQIEVLQKQRAKLTNFIGLLYGYGKAVLERQVRGSFRLLGFSVPEPEEYKGEWDVNLVDPSGRTAIGEVEGSEGFVDVNKYRQLLDYVDTEALEGRDHKGILIGNGFRLRPPKATERQQQFSDHVLRGAARNSFCLLPATELFKAVCAVLENPDNEALKSEIRDSILKHVGVWAFVRQSLPATTASD